MSNSSIYSCNFSVQGDPENVEPKITNLNKVIKNKNKNMAFCFSTVIKANNSAFWRTLDHVNWPYKT